MHVPSAAKACKIDADKYCNVTWFFGYKAGQVIACLRCVCSTACCLPPGRQWYESAPAHTPQHHVAGDLLPSFLLSTICSLPQAVAKKHVWSMSFCMRCAHHLPPCHHYPVFHFSSTVPRASWLQGREGPAGARMPEAGVQGAAGGGGGLPRGRHAVSVGCAVLCTWFGATWPLPIKKQRQGEGARFWLGLRLIEGGSRSMA